jgi:hypothetical protein
MTMSVTPVMFLDGYNNPNPSIVTVNVFSILPNTAQQPPITMTVTRTLPMLAPPNVVMNVSCRQSPATFMLSFSFSFYNYNNHNTYSHGRQACHKDGTFKRTSLPWIKYLHHHPVTRLSLSVSIPRGVLRRRKDNVRHANP